MSFVSFSIWQIRLSREQDLRNALVGFLADAEAKLLDADSPFKFYEKMKESLRRRREPSCSTPDAGMWNPRPGRCDPAQTDSVEQFREPTT